MFPFNHIDDECTLLKAISEISTNSDILIRHHSETKIFNHFEVGEDDSNILETQGDLDPDKCFLIITLIAYWKHATTKLRKLLIIM